MVRRRKLYGLMVVMGALISLFAVCSTDTTPEQTTGKLIEIVQPIVGEELSLRNKNILIARFNTDSVNAPLNRFFSRDGIKWTEMTAHEPLREVAAAQTQGTDPYSYYVLVWKPIDDLLQSGDTIYVKMSGYAAQEHVFQKIGPFTID